MFVKKQKTGVYGKRNISNADETKLFIRFFFFLNFMLKKKGNKIAKASLLCYVVMF